ncbi:hypothetical protein HYT25_02530 [Candidatus Pacearchaeota archaeon]|nr:hypothetical protein [Candidatus Pacearchaeota archaeon]
MTQSLEPRLQEGKTYFSPREHAEMIYVSDRYYHTGDLAVHKDYAGNPIGYMFLTEISGENGRKGIIRKIINIGEGLKTNGDVLILGDLEVHETTFWEDSNPEGYQRNKSRLEKSKQKGRKVLN